jgi:hypothetical protein
MTEKKGTHCEIGWYRSKKYERRAQRLVVAKVGPVVQGPSLR